MNKLIISRLVNRLPVPMSPVPMSPITMLPVQQQTWIRRRRAAIFPAWGRSGFGLNEVIGIAAGIIIAVVIVIPGLQVFARNVLSQLTSWWNGMAVDIFQN